jgi:hypothetical protein
VPIIESAMPVIARTPDERVETMAQNTLVHPDGVTHDKVMVALELPEPGRLRRILPCRQL